MPENHRVPVRLHNTTLVKLLIYGIGPVAWLCAGMRGYVDFCAWCLRLTKPEVQRPDGRWVRANLKPPADWTVC